MNKPAEPIFAIRPTVTLELPLTKNTRILHPDQVILKVGSSFYDIGAFCYTLRSHQRRKPGQPREVVLGSLLNQRPCQIRQVIKVFSRLVSEAGITTKTLNSRLDSFKWFLDWADLNGWHDCLSGGDATRKAYLAWVEETRERYRRQEFGGHVHNYRLHNIRELLEATTDLEDLHRGVRTVKGDKNPNGSTEPLAPHDFAHAVALNLSLFEGLCDLVLEQQPFPFKLVLPATLGWDENHLWLFPTRIWRLPPYQWGAEREKLYKPHWPYDYANGQLSNVDEIMHRYPGTPGRQRSKAKSCLAQARAQIQIANADARNHIRIMLGMIAHSAFLFLFFSNTGANESVAREIETDGEIDAATLNQKFRSIKLRASGKPIALTVPATFMPSLRRFMDLRRYLLNGQNFPYLFFTFGKGYKKPAEQLPKSPLLTLYDCQLRTIDPQLPRIGSRKLRASVADWYQRHHDASVTARVLQNTEQTTQKHYDAGSVTHHHEELSVFLNAVSDAAKRQRVVSVDNAADTRVIEEGGCCDNFGHPEALGENVPANPNCRDSQGCLFCAHRVLVASEEDARKVASAAFIMEEVILGPQHQEFLRPLIAKCDEDLEKIASFGNCRAMVERVRNDVFQNGNLTPFFADKYQLFLELAVIV